ncbi:MAG: DedA family protein [Chloroflexi bacterium]|nr:DedA family protein [Chloroflexota bacterium]
MGWPGVVVLMALESACIPIPSEVIMPLSGWMLVRDRGLGVEGTFIAGFYGALGCTIGSLGAYAVGANGGRKLLWRYGKFVLISHHDLELADRWFQRYGDLAIFLSRLMPVVRTFISFPAGVSRMHLGKFTLYTFAGSLPWCWALALGGYYLGEHWEQLRAVMRPFDIPIILAILALAALYVYRHLQNSRAPVRHGPDS